VVGLVRGSREIARYQTAWTLLHKLRSGLAAHPVLRLKGEVEADET
jgi:hypothetical protein